MRLLKICFQGFLVFTFRKIQEEGLKTFLLTFSIYYETFGLKNLSELLDRNAASSTPNATTIDYFRDDDEEVAPRSSPCYDYENMTKVVARVSNNVFTGTAFCVYRVFLKIVKVVGLMRTQVVTKSSSILPSNTHRV